MRKAVADYLRVSIAYYNEAQQDKSKHLTFEEVKNSIADTRNDDCVIDMAQDIHAMTDDLKRGQAK